MKTEQEQIEKMRRTIYNTRSKVNGIATAGDIAEALVQAGYGDVSEYKAEIERLKDDYAKLQEQFAQYQMASDKEIIAQKKEAEQLFESNMKAVLEIEKKQSQIDVLNKLKERAIGYTFLGEKLATETDIDELIKEVENGEDKG